jgi:hypothetical protein
MRTIFLDCDGVLADFDKRAFEIFGQKSREAEDKLGSDEFWNRIIASGEFYARLPLMHDAPVLVEGVRRLHPEVAPVILTGCPPGGWSETQKREWRDHYFPGVEMITCASKDKYKHGKPGDVLIDDFLKYRHLWVEMGGIFIHHKTAEQSLAELEVILSGAISGPVCS